MTLYYEDTPEAITEIRQRGFAAVLGGDKALCSDRSHAGEDPVEGMEEMEIEAHGDLKRFEFQPTDLPDGRWFDVEPAALDEMWKRPE